MVEKLVVLVWFMAMKGGIGKSFLTQIFAALAQARGWKLLLLDADGYNSSTTTVYEDAKFTDLSRPEGVGPAISALQDIGDKKADVVGWDIAAGHQTRVVANLPRLAAVAKRAGVPMVWVHPITTSHHVQREAIDAVEIARKFDIALVYARNLGQGRVPHDYRFWDKSTEREEALKFAVECEIPDAGSFYGDNAAGFGLSLYDVAYGRFDRVDPDELAIVKELFDRDFQCFAAQYLGEATDNLEGAIMEALGRVSKKAP